MSAEHDYHYVGEELTLFATAVQWKRYFSKLIRPYLGTSVLEVGAGMGGTTEVLARDFSGRWVCLEPDPRLHASLVQKHNEQQMPAQREFRCATTRELHPQERFDAILYIDVLEHIADDQAELCHVSQHLATGGHLVILAPAHQWLFSEFDKSVGHYRRYAKASLTDVMPQELRLCSLRYLDSAGVMLSLANRLLLRKALPSQSDINTWDKLVVPCSRLLDPLLGYRVGKSILGIWSLVIRD